MHNQPDSETSGIFTYLMGIFFIAIGKLGLNDWLILLSIVLVVMRIIQEGKQLFFRRNPKKNIPDDLEL